MKKVLDFTKVPLDKWVDLYTQVETAEPCARSIGTQASFEDIKEIALVDVMEESDLDAEIAEKLHNLEGQAFLALPKDIQELLEAKSSLRGSVDSDRTEKETEARKKKTDREGQG